MTKLYYQPPTDEAFEDMRKAALEVWGQYLDSPGDYYKEKTGRLKEIGNVGDNFMYIFAMFDINNQRKCATLLSDDTKKAVWERMLDGGNHESYTDSILGL